MLCLRRIKKILKAEQKAIGSPCNLGRYYICRECPEIFEFSESFMENQKDKDYKKIEKYG